MASGEFFGQYDYPAKTRRLPVVVLAVWVLAGAGLYAYIVVSRGTVPPFEAQFPLLAVYAVLALVALAGIFLYRKLLKRIDISEQGLWVGGVQEAGSKLVPWDSVERIAEIPRSGRKGATPSKAGLYIYHSDGALMIYDVIEGFEQLKQSIAKRVAITRAV